MSDNRNLFHAAHYNIIAKQLRTLYEETLGPTEDDPGEQLLTMIAQRTIEEVALRLAKRFQQDNELFDPIKFLDACSPNTDLVHMSELWENNA